jgi:PAS domain S-box-containing protein
VARKPTYAELEQRVKELERQLADTGVGFSLKDYTSYQSVLAAVRGVRVEEDEDSLINTFLSEIVKQFGFSMSWYGRHENGTIKPLFSVGRVDRYLDNLVLEIQEPTSPDALCAMSEAVLRQTPFSYGDLRKDKGFRRWRDYALELGYRSNLAMPLRIDGRIEGGVMVYADTPHAFSELRIVRLQQLTGELGTILNEKRVKLKAEKALRESEENFKALAENANDGIMIWVREGVHVYANKQATEIMGYSASELRKITIEDLTLPEEVKKIKERYRMIVEGEDFPVRFENVLIRKDGKPIPIETTSARTTWLGEPADLVIFRDITERKRAEEELHKAHDEMGQKVKERTGELLATNEQLRREIENRKRVEERLRESEAYIKGILNAAPMGIGLVHGRVISWISDPMCAMLGYSADELVGQSARIAYESDEEFESVGAVKYSEIQERGAGTVETRLKRKDGSVIDVLLCSSGTDNADLTQGTIFTALDITERKQAEQQLRESEQRYRSLFKNNHSVMLLVDQESADIVDANTAACSFYGWSQEKLTSMKITDINMLADEQVFQEIERAKSEARNHFFFRHRLASEEIRDVEVYSGPIRVHGKELLYSIIHDISERKRAEEALRQRESELTTKSQEMEELNAALKVLLKRREEDKENLQENVLVNVEELIFPYIEKLKNDHLSPQQTTLVSIIESNIKEIVSPFATKLSSKFLNLTPTELQVASLVKKGRSSNEIAELMNLSPNTILFHRYNLRRKLGLKQTKVNLRTYLRSLEY